MSKSEIKFYLIGLILLVIASFSFHGYFHQEHFQEIDSDVVFHSLKHFDEFAYQYNQFSYQNNNLNNTHKKFRESLISLVSSWNLPDWFKGVFYIPYSTTYSPGMGLFYGVVYSKVKDYNSFLSIVIILLQCLFHLSVLSLFFILLKMEISVPAAFLTSLIYLFSVSHYSYAYNLGSPLWTVLSAMAWMAVFVFSNEKVRDRNISWATAVLIFFNYLILIYWLGYLLQRFLREKNLLKVLSTQIAAGFFIFICALVFVQPGQGVRGIPVYLYEMHHELSYILVNYTALFTSQNLFLVQSVVTIVPLLLLLYKILTTKLSELDVCLKLVISICGIYMLFVVCDLLAFLASRHMLFLSTVFFIALAFGFDRGLASFLPEKGKERILLMISLLIIVLAPFALWQRKNEVKDLLKTPATADLANLILMDSRFEFPHNQKNSWISVPAFGVGLINFYELQLGQKYNYLSQWVSLSEFIGQSEFRRAHQKTKKNQSLSRRAKILAHQDRCVPVAFMAYERFRYGFQKMNCFYFSQFEVIEDKGISISAGPEVTN